MNCGALILAAGASTRLGRPKQLVRLGDETLIDRAIRVATEAGCTQVVIVLGAFEEQIRDQCDLRNIFVISNPDWKQGMGTSLSLGAGAFSNTEGLLVMTCDMPAVTADHLKDLAASSQLRASSYGNRKGVPAYFPTALIPELQKLRGDVGARELLKYAEGIELPGGEFDVDTPEGLAQAQAKFYERGIQINGTCTCSTCK